MKSISSTIGGALGAAVMLSTLSLAAWADSPSTPPPPPPPRPATPDPVVAAACRPDIKALCADVKPGEGRIGACLKSNRQALSTACKDAIRAHRQAMPPAVATPGVATPGSTPPATVAPPSPAQVTSPMAEPTRVVTIYHNPACGTSRTVLALIRGAGFEPVIIEYLKTPPDRATLETLLQPLGMRPRELLRQKGTPYDQLDLGADRWSDAQLVEQMLAHPILINRPIVITPSRAKLCRPSETVNELLAP